MNSQPVTCAFGSAWMVACKPSRPCLKCLAYAAELDRRFAVDVLTGRFDICGFTPSERRAQQRKAAAA